MAVASDEQPSRKTRSRTGCLTCRHRRLKCDEGKPTCNRCHKANLVCDGYEAPRHVAARPAREPGADGATPPSANGSSPRYGAPSRRTSSQSTALPCEDLFDQPIHSRAIPTLAHSHYASRTSKLLFKHDHLWFWRDRVLSAAYGIESIFNAVVALGAIHTLALLLSRQESHASSHEVKAVAMESYENAMAAISAVDAQDRASSDVCAASHLLLAYFQCFNHNAAMAFRHLKAAKQIFLLNEIDIRERLADIPLRICIRRFDLMAKALLPQLINGFEPTVPVLHKQIQDELRCESPIEEKEALMALIEWDDWCHLAIWKSFTAHALEKAPDILEDLQNDLLDWRAQATHTFEHYDDALISSTYADANPSVLDQLPIPPSPQRLCSNDAAMTAALYHACMVRVMAMRSAGQEQENTCEVLAQIHAYEVLRIAEGLLSSDSTTNSGGSLYKSCEAINSSLVSLLFLTSQACYNLDWQDWIAAKLRTLGHEGVHDGAAYATSLQCLKLVQQHHGRDQMHGHETRIRQSCRPLGHVANPIIPLLVSNTEAPTYVAYYVRAFLPRVGRKLILGRAAWTVGLDGNAQNLSLQFFDRESPINVELGGGCAYEFLAATEPAAIEWQRMLTS